MGVRGFFYGGGHLQPCGGVQWQVNLMGALTFLCFFFNIFFLKVNCGPYIVCYLCEGRYWFQCIGHGYMACIYYMDPDVYCPKIAVKLNHSHTQFDSVKLDETPNSGCTICYQNDKQCTQQLRPHKNEDISISVNNAIITDWFAPGYICGHESLWLYRCLGAHGIRCTSTVMRLVWMNWLRVQNNYM